MFVLGYVKKFTITIYLFVNNKLKKDYRFSHILNGSLKDKIETLNH